MSEDSKLADFIKADAGGAEGIAKEVDLTLSALEMLFLVVQARKIKKINDINK
ncbi:MAG: hypothetical protein ACJ0A6_00255 [Dehalococcoidia bacterium]